MGHRCMLVIVIAIFAFSGNTLAQPNARKFGELVLGWGTFTSGRAGWQAAEDEMKVQLAQYAKRSFPIIFLISLLAFLERWFSAMSAMTL